MFKKTLFILLSVIIAFAIYAKTSEEITSDLQNKYKGLEDKINDIMIEQTMIALDEEDSIDMQMKMYSKGNKFRLETIINIDSEDMEEDGITLNNLETTIIGDGNKTWVIAPFVGKMEMEEDGEQEEQLEYAELIFWWNDLGDDMTLLREEKFNGKDCYLMEYKDEDGDESMAWIEKSTMNILKIQDSEDDKSYILFKDYKKLIDDYQIPYKVEMFDDNEKAMDMSVKNVSVNKGINDDMFDPEKVKTPTGGIDINIKGLFGN